MATKKKISAPASSAPTADSVYDYLHLRISRLERNSGMKVHPHPTKIDYAEQAKEAKDAAETLRLANLAKAAEKRRVAKEAEDLARLKEADDAAALVAPGAAAAVEDEPSDEEVE